jgi:cytochrome c2
MRLAKRVAAITPAEGAETIVYLASSPELSSVSGRYFAKCREAQPTAAASDAAAARRLWEESARIAGIAA